MKRMKSRAPSAVLILILLATPLGAVVCGNCVPEHCALAEVTADETPEKIEPSSHCQQTEMIAEDEATDPGLPSATDAADCCAVAESPEPEPQVVTTVSTSLEIALATNKSGDAHAVRPCRATRQRPKLPLLAPQPLYTLHSTLLI